MKNFLILAIDTSCDETSVAVTCGDRVLSNIVSSQVEIHKKWGGVVPNLAKREHQKMIEPAIKEALQKALPKFKKFHPKNDHPLDDKGLKGLRIDAITITIGPGLAPALEVGIAKVKELSKKWNKPLIAVNHMEGHLLSSFAKNSKNNGPFSKIKPQFPILGLLVSGGHTQLVLMKNFGRYKLLGETLDDAAGEAFDKVAKMLDLGYPGGPIISELALKGKPKYELPVPMKHSNDLNFSFSGLKTACLYRIKGLKEKGVKDNKRFICDFSASFVKSAVEALTFKLEKAIKIHHPKQIVLGGGVISNLYLRKEVRKTAKKYNIKVFIPYNKKLFTDNAGMIGVCAWHQAKRGDFVKDIDKLDRLPNLNF